MTQVEMYDEIQREPSGNPWGSALGNSLVLRLCFTVYPSSRQIQIQSPGFSLQSAVSRLLLQIAVQRLQSGVYRLESAVCSLHIIVNSLQVIVCSLQVIVCMFSLKSSIFCLQIIVCRQQIPVTAFHEPSAKYYQLSCLHGRWRKIGKLIKNHQI